VRLVFHHVYEIFARRRKNPIARLPLRGKGSIQPIPTAGEKINDHLKLRRALWKKLDFGIRNFHVFIILRSDQLFSEFPDPQTSKQARQARFFSIIDELN